MMKQDLADLGYNMREIKAMTPQEAQYIIEAQRTKH
jgi:hypothetical protein